MEYKALNFSIFFFLLFSNFNFIIGQIEIEQDSTISIGSKITPDAYLKVKTKPHKYGMYLQSVFSNSIQNTRYGLLNKMIVSSSNEYRGIQVEIPTNSTPPSRKMGVYTRLEGKSNTNTTGTYNWIRDYETTAYGTFNNIGNTVTPGNISFGTYSYSTSDDSSLKYGHQNFLLGSARTVFGMNNVVRTITSSHSFGIFNSVHQYDSNIVNGLRNNIITSPTGTEPSFGSFNYIFDKNNESVYGTYNLIVPEATVTSGTKYGSYNVITSGGNPGIVYGVYANINNHNGYAGYFKGPLYTSTGTLVGSDIRLKENIRDLESNLEKVLLLRPRSYILKENAALKHKNHFGFLAQEVLEILPDIVYEIDPPYSGDRILESPASSVLKANGEISVLPASYRKDKASDPSVFLALQYDALIPILVGAIQEQQDQINRIGKGQVDVEGYDQRIQALENELGMANQKLIDNFKTLLELERRIDQLQNKLSENK